MKLAISRAEDELRRLISLGFSDWEQDINGVRVRQSKQSDEQRSISFPQLAYEGKSLKSDDFWSRHRANVIAEEIQKTGYEVIWEIGGGDGRVGIHLAKVGIGVISVEPLYAGCVKVAKSELPVFLGTLPDLELPSGTINSVGFFDVLEHIEDDQAFLEYLNSILTEHGSIFLTVPAHKWLFSEHDLALGHFRRYSRRDLRKLLERCGFVIVREEHLYSALVIPAIFMRRIPYLLGKRRGNTITLRQSEDVLNISKVLDKLLSLVLTFERKFKLSFGLSIFLVAEKKAQ